MFGEREDNRISSARSPRGGRGQLGEIAGDEIWSYRKAGLQGREKRWLARPIPKGTGKGGGGPGRADREKGRGKEKLDDSPV